MSSHRLLPCFLRFLLLVIASGGVAEVGDRARAPRFPHASLAAYPDAVISLKDPRTGMTFYVESDGRRLIAVDRDGAFAWGLDVFAEAKVAPAVGKPVVRHLRLNGNRLWATCGKHDFVRIDVTTGEARYAGAD
jgi:hypothetical protein